MDFGTGRLSAENGRALTPETEHVDQKTGLLRAVSRWEIVALSVNDVIGSGVYLILPVAAAQLLGPASVWAILAAGFAVLLLVLCFAEASSLFDRPGGRDRLHARGVRRLRRVRGRLDDLDRPHRLDRGPLGLLRARGGISLARRAKSGVGQWATIVLPLLVLTWINVRGVKSGARTAVVLAWGKVLPLVLFVAVGLFWVDWSRVFPVPMPERANFMKAALLVLFAYAGFENTPAPAGEFMNPQRDVPFALIVQIAIVTAIYTTVQLVAIGTMPNLGASPTPLADAAAMMMGPVGGLILTLGAVLSVLGTNNNTVLAGPRYLYALAEMGRLPAVFAKIHPRYRTPHVAILTQTGVALLARCSTGDRPRSSPCSRRSRGSRPTSGTAAAVPVLRRKMPATPRTIRLPGGPADPDRGARHLPPVPLGRRRRRTGSPAASRSPSGPSIYADRPATPGKRPRRRTAAPRVALPPAVC